LVDQYGIVYIVLLGVCLFLINKSYKSEKKSYLYAVIILLTLVVGFRDYSVGIDTINYKDGYDLILFGKSRYFYGVEESYKIIISIILKIVPNVRFLFLFTAFVTNYCIVVRVWSFRNIASPTFAFFVFYAVLFFYEFNISRQMVAVAMVFYGTKFLQERKYGLYIIFIIIASFFHKSALLALSFFAVELLLWKYLDSKQKRLIGISLMLTPVAFVYINDYFNSKAKYFEVSNVNIGMMQIAKTLLLLLVVLLEYKKIFSKNKDTDDRVLYCQKSLTIYYLIGNLLSYLGYFYNTLDRIGLYYSIFEGVFWSVSISNIAKKENKSIIRFCVCFLEIYILFNAIKYGGQGQIPYILGGF